VKARTPDGGADADGRSPIAVCRRWYGLNAHTGIDPSTVRFVACRHTTTTVNVYVSDNHPNQCGRLGDQPLPTRYPAALSRLRNRGRQLIKIQRRFNCISPRALAAQTRAALTSVGFENWRVVLPPAHLTPQQLNAPAGTNAGPCGSLIAMPAFNSPDSAIEVQANQRKVYISAALPRHTDRFLYRTQGRLYSRTYNHCFTATALRQLVTQAFAGASLQPRFATYAIPAGEGFEPRSQKLYDQGCVRFHAAYASDDDRYVDVWLDARTQPRLPAHQTFPPASAFRPY
jgi:hypothetical protein